MKKYFLIAIIFTLVFTGCLAPQGASATGSIDGVKISYDGDTTFSFTSKDATKEKLSFEVENTGAHTIPEGRFKIKVSGLDPSEYNIGNVDSLTIKSRNDLDTGEFLGGEALLGESQIYAWDFRPSTSTNERNLPFEIKACYEYQNLAQLTYCNRGNNFEEGEICNPNGKKVFGNTRNPIILTNVEQKPISKTTSEITITLKNSGSGNIYLNEEKLCDKTKKDRITVYVDYEKEFCGGEKGCISCKGLVNRQDNEHATEIGDLRISKDLGQAQLSCTVKNPEETDLEKEIRVLLKYQYEIRQKHQIKLLNVEE